MRSAQEITGRIAEAKQELLAITNPVAHRADGSEYFPDHTQNDAVKLENDKKVIALNAEIKALTWAEEGEYELVHPSSFVRREETPPQVGPAGE